MFSKVDWGTRLIFRPLLDVTLSFGQPPLDFFAFSQNWFQLATKLDSLNLLNGACHIKSETFYFWQLSFTFHIICYPDNLISKRQKLYNVKQSINLEIKYSDRDLNILYPGRFFVCLTFVSFSPPTSFTERGFWYE